MFSGCFVVLLYLSSPLTVFFCGLMSFFTCMFRFFFSSSLGFWSIYFDIYLSISIYLSIYFDLSTKTHLLWVCFVRPISLIYNNFYLEQNIWASQVMLVVKNPPANAGISKRCRFDPSGWEDPLEEDMATQSSILAWKIPWMEQPGRL